MATTVELLVSLQRIVSLSDETLLLIASGSNNLAGRAFETNDWQPTIEDGRVVIGGSVDGIIQGFHVDAKLILGTSFFFSMEGNRYGRKHDTHFACYEPDVEAKLARLTVLCRWSDLHERMLLRSMLDHTKRSNGETGIEVWMEDAKRVNLL